MSLRGWGDRGLTWGEGALREHPMAAVWEGLRGRGERTIGTTVVWKVARDATSCEKTSARK